MSSQAAVIGKNAPGIYKQAFVLGKFLVIILLEDGEELDLEFGRNFVSKVEEIIDQTPDISTQQLLELVSGHLLQQEFHLRAIIGKIHDQKLTVSSQGELSAKLIRKNKVVALVEQGNPQTITGPLQHADVLFFGTAEFFELATPDLLTKQTSSSPETIRDQLIPQVEIKEKSEQIVGLIFEVDLLPNEPVATEAATIPDERTETLEEAVASNQSAIAFSPEKHLSGGGGLVKKVFELFSSLPGFVRPGLHIRQRETDEQQSAGRRRWLFLVLAGFVTLACIVGFQLRSKVTEGQMKVVANLETVAKEAVSSSDKIVGLNDQIARETLTAARSEVVAKAKEIFGEDWETKNDPGEKKVKEILSYLDEHLQAALKKYPVESLQTYTDFSLLKSDPKIISANLVAGKIVALDQANGALYSVTTDTKTAAIVGGSTELKSGQSVDFSPNTAFVFGHDVFSVDIKNGGAARKVIGFDNDWGKILGIRSFAGNLYLLDTSLSEIWKYSGGESGFASRSAYLQSGLAVDFSKVTDFTIDGTILVLSTSGNVAQFSAGAPTDFKLSGMTDQLQNPTSIFASEDTEAIYVYDEGSTRVVLFEKNGVYKSQYALPKPSEKIIKVLADEGTKKIFLVTPTKILTVDLK